MTDISKLNFDRGVLRGRVNELELRLARWRFRLGLVGVDMDLGPEKAKDRLLDLSNALKEVPKLREKLSAYEAQMRYQIEAFDSESYYRAPEAIVVLHGETVCGCDSMGEAAKIAAALNLLPEKDNVG